MHITIEDDFLIYIYLKDQSKYTRNGGGGSAVSCFLLYDQNGNWIGVRITNKDTEGNTITLPDIGDIDYPIHNGEVVMLNDEIIIKFDKDLVVEYFKKQDCNLDIHPEGIYGIEMIL